GYVGWILFFISLAVFQSLVVALSDAGLVGQEIHSSLLPFIGKAGLWLFWLMIFMLALVLVIDDDYDFRGSWEKIKSLMGKKEPKDDYEIEDNKPNKIMSLNSVYSTMRTIFQNPFNFQKKRDIDDILHMNLDPEDEIVTPRYMGKIEQAVEKRPEIAEQQLGIAADTDTTLDIPTPIKPKTTRARRKPAVKKSGVEIVDELEENSKILAQMEKGTTVRPKNFRLPKIDFLQKAPKITRKINEAEIDRKIEDLLSKLQQFKVDGDVVRTYSGPLVTTFEFKPAPNVKVSKILGLQDDLAMALSAETIRIQAPIPGRDVVGIEIPNETIDTIYLRDILESDIFKESSSPLTVALGKDIVGKPFITDLKKLPHLLIAGTTGSGKSVGINSMILSLLYRNDPEYLKLMLIDPKMLEFSMYNDIPHLITPVITEPMKAVAALANMVGEMERRYKLMAESRTKNIENYNEKAKREGVFEEFPYIVIVIDELADLMMNAGKEVEISIARLAQKSRACGIHLVVATQRPSVDVVTGLIKANLPSRLSYRVGQRIDSKVILDAMGAESLLGRGDGLFTPPGSTGLVRIHAPWSTEEEIDKVVDFLKAQREPDYDESYLVVGGAVNTAGDIDEP
ncbi:MAG TPA: DNA translocase FtsK, partial [Sulfurovum sp.]|nr:DNA translocase FtsK [Sulfurovum sp.]